MVEVLIFAVTVFSGWLLLDYVKHKKLTKENVASAAVSGAIAGVAWYVLFVIF